MKKLLVFLVIALSVLLVVPAQAQVTTVTKTTVGDGGALFSATLRVTNVATTYSDPFSLDGYNGESSYTYTFECAYKNAVVAASAQDTATIFLQGSFDYGFVTSPVWTSVDTIAASQPLKATTRATPLDFNNYKYPHYRFAATGLAAVTAKSDVSVYLHAHRKNSPK
jgi:hypothetical protein